MIVLQKIGHQFEGHHDNLFVVFDEKQGDGEDDALFPNAEELENDIKNATDRGSKNDANKNEIDATCTLIEICTILADELFAEKERIKKDLSPIFDYNYNRIYHLSKIRDDLYDELLSETPKCLRKELYEIMTKVRGYNINTLPFYDYNSNFNKKRRKSAVKKMKVIHIDWTMRTDELMGLLEQDMNLTKGELSADCDLLMNNFYSNLWDWFFITDQFWETLPYYDSFEIVRIRIYELMEECVEKYNINENKTIPTFPELWLKRYDGKLSIEQVLFGGNKKLFSFDGVDWNETTMNKIKLIHEYLNKNYVGKLHLVAEEHCNNNDVWNKYMNDNKIPSHIRFKMNFYSIRGNIQTDDEWLNDYIKSNYPNLPPQHNQTILTPIPIIDDIQCSPITKTECTV